MNVINGTTKVCGLIGNPVGHSISPLIHNKLARLCNIDMVYTTFKVEKGCVETAVKGAFALDIKGLNVTVPHKNEVMKYLSAIDEGGQAIGAVNTLVRTENGYKGYSYMQDHTKEAGRAFDAHSKDKDSFYSKKCKKDELNELWERD